MAVHPAAPARAYWDTAAETYNQDFTLTLIRQTRRTAVLRELDRVFRSGQRVLALNWGTGVDALHLAERGLEVLACDFSPRMIDLTRARTAATPFENRTQFRVLASEEIRTHAAADRLLGGLPLLRSMADCVLLELKRNEIAEADHGASPARS